MRAFIAVFALGYVSSVAAVGLPACAGTCVSAFGLGGCPQLGYECICSNSQLIANLACCVSKTCNAADQQETIQFADALCAGQQVTNLPSAATCAPGALSTPASTATSSVNLSSILATAASSTTSSAKSDARATGLPRIGLGMAIAGGLAIL